MLPSVDAPPRGWAVGRTFDTVDMLGALRPAPLPHRSQQQRRRPEPYRYKGGAAAEGHQQQDTAAAAEDGEGEGEGRGGPADADEAAEELRYLRAKQAIREGRGRNLERDVNQARLPSSMLSFGFMPFHVHARSQRGASFLLTSP